MSLDINDHEFTAVVSLPAPRRYAYCIKRVADWYEIWSLRTDDGWALAHDDEGNEVIPIWPAARYAAACSKGYWSNDKPKAICMDDWLQKWIPGMLQDGALVAVFPSPDDKGVVVTPDRLRSDLEEELERYEYLS